MNYDTSFVSEIGGRKVNEDTYGYQIAPSGGCWVVADGLGGHRGGQPASFLAVKTVMESLALTTDNSPNTLHRSLETAQNAIIAGQQSDHELYAMRTTIVLLVIQNDQARWAHLGDSRLYAFHKNRVVFQTKDHSVPQVLVSAGDIRSENIRGHEDRNRLLRSLGNQDDFRPVILRILSWYALVMHFCCVRTDSGSIYWKTKWRNCCSIQIQLHSGFSKWKSCY